MMIDSWLYPTKSIAGVPTVETERIAFGRNGSPRNTVTRHSCVLSKQAPSIQAGAMEIARRT
jgi:hypothetical protein